MAKTTKKTVATPKSVKTTKNATKVTSAKAASKKVTSVKPAPAKTPSKKAPSKKVTPPKVAKPPKKKALPKGGKEKGKKVVKSAKAKPVVSKLAASKPKAPKAIPSKPSASKAAASKSKVTKPSVSKSPVSKPVAPKPAASKPKGSKPAASKSKVTKSSISKSHVSKPVAPKLPASRPKGLKPAVSKPSVSKSAVKQLVTKKTSGNKAPVVSIPEKQEKPKPVPAKLVVKEVSSKKVTSKKSLPAKTKESAVPKEKGKGFKTFSREKFDFTDDKGEVTIERKLMALYNLQQIDSQIDKIRIIRGELPLEVQDLEDEIAGLETRIENYVLETVEHEKIIHEKEISIQDSQGLIKKYGDQQMNVRNNREYDSLTKEIEFQNLEIQLSQKRIREAQLALDAKKEEIAQFQKVLQDRKNDLEVKKNELDDIVAETEKEENDLIKHSELNHKYIEERLITAYTRIRKNARNGLAVVQIERDACGGCFNKIPPQHQLDIRMHKKIIVCEYCGRILVDDIIVNAVN